MQPADVLREAHLVGRLDQFGLSRHAVERMEERDVNRRDIGRALQSATLATPDGPRWRLDGGTDEAGESLTVVLVFVGAGIVVTVF